MKTSILTTLVLVSQMGWASPQAPKAQPVKETKSTPILQISEPTISREELQAAYDQATRKLNELENLLAANQPGPALQAAMETLNMIKVKTGVNPMAQFTEKIQTSGVLSSSDLKTPFASLSNTQQENLARVVAAHKGGLFIPLLNVAKRVRVIYVKAFYEANKVDLLKRDAQKMLTDLMRIHNIGILVHDREAGDDYMLFDLDVADSDYQYQFNKEVMVTALGYAQVIGTTEDEFETSLTKDRADRLQEHWNGMRTVVKIGKTSNKQANFDKCMDAHSGWPNKVYATEVCLQKASSYTYVNNPNYDTCMRYHKDWPNQSYASDVCTEKAGDYEGIK